MVFFSCMERMIIHNIYTTDSALIINSFSDKVIRVSHIFYFVLCLSLHWHQAWLYYIIIKISLLLIYIHIKCIYLERKEEYPVLRYRVLSEDSFLSPIFSLQLLLAVAVDRKSAWYRVTPLNHLSSPYTLTSHKDQCKSQVIIMHRPVDPRQIAVSDLSKVIYV
jgi:hypothetical protein